MKTYAAYYDNEIRLSSSSGGLFSLIASKFEVVYGVAMNEKCDGAEFKRVENGDITLLRGSKYLQARVGDTYKQIKIDLLNCKRVLFTGTACQVNGLKTFLQKEYPNLTTIDVICHGVPSPVVWRKYIEGKNVNLVNFRAKDFGWTKYGMKLNEEFIPNNQNRYMQLYLTNLALRPSCFECVSKNNKNSDITLGDFWGIDNVLPELYDDKGTSIFIARTAKGQDLFDEIKHMLLYKEVEYAEAIKCNPCEFESTFRPDSRERFFVDMSKMDFDNLYHKYTDVPLWRRVARKMKRLIKKL